MQKDFFILTSNVVIDTEVKSEPVRRAVMRFYRDLAMVLEPNAEGMEKDRPGIIYLEKGSAAPEEFQIHVENSQRLIISASEELGFIYALLYISEHCLGILPFWFWNNQKFVKQKEIPVPFRKKAGCLQRLVYQ